MRLIDIKFWIRRIIIWQRKTILSISISFAVLLFTILGILFFNLTLNFDNLFTAILFCIFFFGAVSLFLYSYFLILKAAFSIVGLFKEKLFQGILLYISIIIVSMCVYSNLIIWANYNDVKSEYYHYYNITKENNTAELKYYRQQQPILSGIDYDIFTRINEHIDNFTSEKIYNFFKEIIEKKQKLSPYLNFKFKSLIKLFIDCFYFSVTTVTTLGYGDIHPQHWVIKIITSLQTLIGLVIIIVSVGLIFSSKSIEELNKETQQIMQRRKAIPSKKRRAKRYKKHVPYRKII